MYDMNKFLKIRVPTITKNFHFYSKIIEFETYPNIEYKTTFFSLAEIFPRFIQDNSHYEILWISRTHSAYLIRGETYSIDAKLSSQNVCDFAESGS